MNPYAELLEFNQPNPIRKEGFTRVRDAFPGLSEHLLQFRVDEDGSIYTDEDGNGYVRSSPYWNPERIVEFAGRWDYGPKNAARLGQTKRVPKPEDGPEAYEDISIIKQYINMGHESMLEMADATFFIECSRVVSHELVRHRIASYQQESQRFVKYDDEDPEDLFYVPPQMEIGQRAAVWEFFINAFNGYKQLRKDGVSPQIARYVFPNATRTRLIMKTNLREWRHICKLRLDKSAQPEMQELMKQIYDQLVDIFPNVMYNAVDGERGVR